MGASAGPRIVVVGSTGSGKTVLARELSRALRIRHIELDALRWDPNWNEVSNDTFRERVAEAVVGAQWIVDGNYGIARDLIWPQATTIVWLDYALRVIIWRLLWRTVKRVFTREVLWNGNQERFRAAFLSRDSLFLWVLQTYWHRRRTYPVEFQKSEHRHIDVAHLRSPKDARKWMPRVSRTCALTDLGTESPLNPPG